jgi:uncharacterized protein YgfB (UPF0149 family)
MPSTVAYDDVARVLAAGASTVHPAEAHGCLCGALCARRDYSRDEWLDEIAPDAVSATSDDAILVTLFDESVGVLARPDMEFEPLLPDDSSALDTRTEALAAWCLGFLYGFGSAGALRPAALGEDVDEVLADFARISNAGAVGSDSAEEEEEAYTELVEFLRAGVQLVYDELAAQRAAQPPVRSGH